MPLNKETNAMRMKIKDKQKWLLSVVRNCLIKLTIFIMQAHIVYACHMSHLVLPLYVIFTISGTFPTLGKNILLGTLF
jgi:hypothetical protein